MVGVIFGILSIIGGIAFFVIMTALVVVSLYLLFMGEK